MALLLGQVVLLGLIGLASDMPPHYHSACELRQLLWLHAVGAALQLVSDLLLLPAWCWLGGCMRSLQLLLKLG